MSAMLFYKSPNLVACPAQIWVLTNMPESILAVVLALILLFGVAVGVLRQVGLAKTESPFIDEQPTTKDQRAA